MVGKKVEPPGINEVQYYIHSREGILQHDDVSSWVTLVHLFKNAWMPSKIVGTKDAVAEEKPEQVKSLDFNEVYLVWSFIS